MVRTYPHAIRKRPRRTHKFVPILSIRAAEADYCHGNHVCEACMEAMAAEAEHNRPGHFWRVEDGELHYKEDDAAEKMLGRKLKPTESVVAKNGNYEDCRPENLEVIEIPEMGK